MGVESNLLAAPQGLSTSSQVAALVPEPRQGQAVDMIFPYSVPSKLDDVDWECVERLAPRAMPLGDSDHEPGLVE